MTATQFAETMKTGFESFTVTREVVNGKPSYTLVGPRGGIKRLEFQSWSHGVTFFTVKDEFGNNASIKGNYTAIEVENMPYLYSFGVNPYTLDKHIRETLQQQ